MIPQWSTATLVLYLVMGLVPIVAIKNEDAQVAREGKHAAPVAFGYVAWAIIWVIFACWRGIGQGLGGSDAPTYVSYFQVCLDSHSDNLYVQHSDLGFALINQFLRLFTSDYHVLFIVLYGFIVFSYIYVVKTFRIKGTSLAPLIAIVFIYIRGFTSLRMNVAVAFILLSVCLLFRGRPKTAILFAIFSIFIHKASILYVCFLFVYLYDRKKGLTLIGCFAGMAVATLAGVLVQKLFLSSSMSFFDNGSYAYYATNSIGSSFFDSFWKIAFGQILLLAMLAFFNKPITSFIKSLPSEDADKAGFLKFIVLFDLATIPVTFVLGIWRGYEYLYIFRLLMWGIVVSAISVGLNRQSKWAINVITLLLFAFWIGNRWFATYADSALMPYVFQLFAR